MENNRPQKSSKRSGLKRILLLIISLIILFALIVGGIFLFNYFKNRQGSTNQASQSEQKAKQGQIDLAALNDSGQKGTIQITSQQNQTLVEINITEKQANLPQPAHIHKGDCKNPGEIVYPLNEVINGKSTTVLNVSLDKLNEQKPLVVNVHKSNTELENYTACSEVK